MARYISTQSLFQTIDEITSTTSRLIVIVPFESVGSQNLFAKWVLKASESVQLTLILSGPFDENPALTLDSLKPICQLQSIRITYHDGPLISRILTDTSSLLLPNGFSDNQSDKAGVLSKLGIDHQTDLEKIESQSRIVYQKVAHFKKKYFGLQKTFDKSSVIENTLGFDLNQS